MIFSLYTTFLIWLVIVIFADKFSFFDPVKDYIVNFGLGIKVVTGTILIFFRIKGVKNFLDVRSLTSLNKRQALTYFNIAWFSLFPNTIWYYQYRLQRGDYPPEGDSITIAIVSSFLFYLFFWPILIFLIQHITKNAELPTKIFFKPSIYSRKEIFLEIIFTLLILFNILAIFDFTFDGDFITIPVSLFLIYLLLTLRAVKLKKEQVVEIEKD